MTIAMISATVTVKVKMKECLSGEAMALSQVVSTDKLALADSRI